MNKPASLNFIRQELANLSSKQLQELCLKLARYKKDNKELLAYLLFEADDELAFINRVKDEIKKQFAEINTSQVFFIRKSVRKILRNVNKYVRYAGSKRIEAELLIFFCSCLNESGIDFRSVPSLQNLYQNQLLKIKKTVASLHEDLQYDYRTEIDRLL